MDMNVVLQAISAVGFPIVISLYLLWYIKELENTHKEESKQFTEALNKNTLVLQKLIDTIGDDRNDDK
jgi:hypothetical protein